MAKNTSDRELIWKEKVLGELNKGHVTHNFHNKIEEDIKCLTIIPTLIENDDNYKGLIKYFDDIKTIVIDIIKLNLTYVDIKKIVFHPSYTYEDFVGGIKPDLEKKDQTDHQLSADGIATQEGLTKPNSQPSLPNSQPSLMYKYTPGVMLDLISKAWENKTVRHYLIIDEFNRGNIAAIFGEFLYLIENDKRSKQKDSGDNYVFLPGGVYPWNDKEIIEPFSEECKIRMPENIFIVGALNTADRSIATMDFAMRRRFNFVKFEPNEELIKGFNWEKKDETGNVQRLFISLNRSIKYKLDADHEIGHYYFMRADGVKEDTIAFLKDLFERKIIPLLEAYCDHDEQTVKNILAISIFLFLKATAPVEPNKQRELIELKELKLLSNAQIKSSINSNLTENNIKGVNDQVLEGLKLKSIKDIGNKSLAYLIDILVSLVRPQK